MHDKIFISYAKEDYEYAQNLYHYLIENNLTPWLDKKNLMPGQRWDYEIQRALKGADFIILLLSDISVNKRGYVQKEFKKAINYCEEKLDSDIYIIPIKINNCEVPADLNKFQWVEYSPDAFGDILQSINAQRKLLLKEEEEKKYRLVGFEYLIKHKKGEYGVRNPKQFYDLTYPQFTNSNNESLNEINVLIESIIINDLFNLRNNYYKYLKDTSFDDYEIDMDSTHDTTISFKLLNKNFVSITYFNSTYETGAAHGNYGTSGHNLLLNPLRKFDIKDLFENFDEILPTLRNIVDEKIIELASNHDNGDVSEDFYIDEEGLVAKEENFDNYFFKDGALVFIYNPYHLTYWSNGDQQPEISFEELIKYFPNESKLINFIKTIKT